MADLVHGIPLVSLVVRDYLVPRLPGVDIRSEGPGEPLAGPFVRLRPAGGNDRNLAIGERMLTVEVWAVSDLEAGQLAEKVHALLRAAPHEGHRVIRRVTTVGAPAQSPDPDNRAPRYRMSLHLKLRAQPVG